MSLHTIKGADEKIFDELFQSAISSPVQPPHEHHTPAYTGQVVHMQHIFHKGDNYLNGPSDVVSGTQPVNLLLNFRYFGRDELKKITFFNFFHFIYAIWNSQCQRKDQQYEKKYNQL